MADQRTLDGVIADLRVRLSAVEAANTDLLARVAATLEHSAAVEAERDVNATGCRVLRDAADSLTDSLRAAEARVEALEAQLGLAISFIPAARFDAFKRRRAALAAASPEPPVT